MQVNQHMENDFFDSTGSHPEQLHVVIKFIYTKQLSTLVVTAPHSVRLERALRIKTGNLNV